MQNNVAYAFTHGSPSNAVNSEHATSTGRYGGKNQNRGGKKHWKKFKGNCKKCGGQGHKTEDCPNTGNNNDKRKCYGCNQVGHIRVNCPHNNNNKKKDEPAFLGMCIRTIESTEEDALTVYKEEVDVEGYVIIDEEGKETTEYVYSDVVLQ
jgi:hypothetical protein